MHRRARRFLVTFVVLCSVGFGVLASGPGASVLRSARHITAETTGRTLALLDPSAGADGVVVRTRGGPIRIIDECTGVYALVVALSFVAAFPMPVGRKIAGAAVAPAAVFLLNDLRLVSLGVAMDRAPRAAAFVHDYLWQVLWVAIVVGGLSVFAVASSRAPRASRASRAPRAP